MPRTSCLALVAVDVLGVSYREASRALKVPEATITTRLFRARKRVAARLLRSESDADPGERAQAAVGTPGAASAQPRGTRQVGRRTAFMAGHL
jgi:predicted RNA polymerase sigma factor